jgi:hypothetical protein
MSKNIVKKECMDGDILSIIKTYLNVILMLMDLSF